MQQEREVATFMANCPPFGNLHIYWLFSRSQIEFILSDVEFIPPAEDSQAIRAHYLEEALPVIDLEEHFGLGGIRQTLPEKYVVLRSSNTDGDLSKVMVRSVHQVRMRKLNFATTPAPGSALQKNQDHILGAFFQDNDTLLIVPDLKTIIEGMDM